jgi:glycosyltransferase involved in cell wall biosynthesis
MSCDITVQVCTCNRAAMVAMCLDALARLEFDPARVEVVVVDDGSTDQTPDLLARVSLPCRLRVVRQAHAGLAAARNAGVRVAEGEVVVFIDDDTLAEPRLLAEHWRSHAEYRRAVVMGRVQHVEAMDVPVRRRLRLADLSTSFFWTCNASVRRRDLLDAGLFDEAFIEYGWEDLEMGDRLRRSGLTRRRNWRAIVRHVKPPLQPGDVPGLLKRAEASGRSAAIYVRKQPTWRARMATGITPTRRRLNHWLGMAERPLHALACRPGGQRLAGVSLASAYLLGRIHYFRAVEQALAAGQAGGGHRRAESEG